MSTPSDPRAPLGEADLDAIEERAVLLEAGLTAHARADIRLLLAEVRRLRAEAERLRVELARYRAEEERRRIVDDEETW